MFFSRVLSGAALLVVVMGGLVRAQAAAPAPGPIIICPNNCDDGNPCTNDYCFDGVCEHLENNNACSDSDPCTYNERCSAGACRAFEITVCKPDQCMDRRCDGRGGCFESPRSGATCNDANPCTYGETCDQAGACSNGRLVSCRSDQCTERTCNGSPSCTVTPRTGQVCNDGNPCTANDSCDERGLCRSGPAVTCESDACNQRVCNGTPDCQVIPRAGAPCSDGDACTFGDQCDEAGTCRAEGKVSCVGDACNLRTCNGTDQCKVIPRTGNRCDDGNTCSHDDLCRADGSCAGTPLVCMSDATVERTCNGGPTCTVTPRPGGACDDGDPCTHGDVRLPDNTCRGTPYQCAVGACLSASRCDGKGGCVSTPKPDETPCEADQSKCTPRDVCRAGVCVPDPRPVKCVERDCNSVTCNPESGNCEYSPTSGGACGVSGCFSEGICSNGQCSGQPKDCSAFASACTEGICDALTGACVAAPKPNGTDCSPGGMCTAQAACVFGVCELPAATCPAPSAACKVAACNPQSGQCAETARPVGSPCDPKNSCISEAACDATGACVGTPAVNGEPCTAASGQLGQCVFGTCVASGSTPDASPPVDAGSDASAPPIAGDPNQGQARPAASAPKKSGCSYGGTTEGLAPLALLFAALLLRRRR